MYFHRDVVLTIHQWRPELFQSLTSQITDCIVDGSTSKSDKAWQDGILIEYTRNDVIYKPRIVYFPAPDMHVSMQYFLGKHTILEDRPTGI